MTLAAQRWTRPLDVEPGHWKKQLPGKLLRIAARGDMDGLRALLAADPEALNRRGNHGRTLLWEAVKAGKVEAVRFLVEAGADLALTGSYNSECHVQLTPYCAAVYYRRQALAAHLQDRSPDPDIFRQAFLGDSDAMMAQVAAAPVLLAEEDPLDEIYFIPLVSFAVAGGHFDLTGRLIERGAEVMPYSAQLLFLAAKDARTDLVDLLVSNGASTEFMETALIVTKDVAMFRHLLVRHREQYGDRLPEGLNLLPIVRGDRAERPDKVAALLDCGAAIDARGPDGRTALHVAARAGQAKVVTLLLARGADPSIYDDEGRTALDLARAASKPVTVDLLMGR